MGVAALGRSFLSTHLSLLLVYVFFPLVEILRFACMEIARISCLEKSVILANSQGDAKLQGSTSR